MHIYKPTTIVADSGLEISDKNTKILNRMEEYLQESEVLEEYGKWHFVMTRPQDTTPVRVSVSTSGISVTANNRYWYIREVTVIDSGDISVGNNTKKGRRRGSLVY